MGAAFLYQEPARLESGLLETLADNPALFIGICGVLGLLIGSFLNVVIHRVPIMMDNELRAECAALAGVPKRRARSADFQHRHAALRLPQLQGADHGAAEHSGGELAGAARQVRQLQDADQRALPAGGARHRHVLGLRGLALRLRRRHAWRRWHSPGC